MIKNESSQNTSNFHDCILIQILIEMMVEDPIEICRDDPAMVEDLLGNRMTDLSVNNNWALGYACRKGNVELLKKILCDPRVDPMANRNRAFWEACARGHVDIVDRLLLDTRTVFDSAGRHNRHHKGLQFACEKGHVPVVERILKDVRVSVTDEGPFDCVFNACEYGQTAVVERLLLDPRIYDDAWSGILLAAAIAYSKPNRYHIHFGHITSSILALPDNANIIGLLLKDDRILWSQCKFPSQIDVRYSWGSGFIEVDEPAKINAKELVTAARKQWYINRAKKYGQMHVELVATATTILWR